MKILIDAGHPAHIHLFRCFAREMENRGHQVLFTARDKEMTYALLDYYHIEYIALGKHYRFTAGKLWGWLKYVVKLVGIIKRFKPDIVMGHGSFYSAQAAYICGVKHISLEDTGNPEQVKLYRLFTQVILTPGCLGADYGYKQIRYPGYHELAYLHPKYFNADLTTVEDLPEKFVLVRLVDRAASHDFGLANFNDSHLSEIIQSLSPLASLFISSERPLPKAFSDYQHPLLFMILGS